MVSICVYMWWCCARACVLCACMRAACFARGARRLPIMSATSSVLVYHYAVLRKVASLQPQTTDGGQKSLILSLSTADLFCKSLFPNIMLLLTSGTFCMLRFTAVHAMKILAHWCIYFSKGQLVVCVGETNSSWN